MGLLNRLFRNNSNTMSNKVAIKYYEGLSDLIKKCYNKDTMEFDWDLYFQERDPYLYCPHQEIVEYLKSELRWVGEVQILGINVFLQNRKPEEVLLFLKEKEENVIRNLIPLCGGGEKATCPEYIVRYRENLYHILREEIPCTKENIEKILLDFANGDR